MSDHDRLTLRGTVPSPNNRAEGESETDEVLLVLLLSLRGSHALVVPLADAFQSLFSSAFHHRTDKHSGGALAICLPSVQEGLT